MYEPNTSEWEKMRKNKIGASEAPIIMKVSPWMTPYQLWEQKLAPYEKSIANLPQQRGHDLEAKGLQEVEKLTGIQFHSEVKMHRNIEWMIATLDGIDGENRHICEIKCPGEPDHLSAIEGKVPEKYFPQLQHQLEVCQLEWGYYFSFDGKAGVLLKIYRDDQYIKKMIEKEREFWECLQNFQPPELTDRDYKMIDSPEWLQTAQAWRSINEQIKSLEEKENQLRKELIGLAGQQSSMGGGIRVSKIMRKGNVDYSSIPELKQVNLDSYRKKSIESWRIIAN